MTTCKDVKREIAAAPTLFGKPILDGLSECVVRKSTQYGMLSYLVRCWHSMLPHSPAGMRVGFIAYARNLSPIGVAMWGRPSARMEDFERTLELTRLAHCPDAPKNMGSWILGQMRKWIRGNMPEIERLISYQDAIVHRGTIYKADNWVTVYEAREESHTWGNREGRRSAERVLKTKWERVP